MKVACAYCAIAEIGHRHRSFLLNLRCKTDAHHNGNHAAQHAKGCNYAFREVSKIMDTFLAFSRACCLSHVLCEDVAGPDASYQHCSKIACDRTDVIFAAERVGATDRCCLLAAACKYRCRDDGLPIEIDKAILQRAIEPHVVVEIQSIPLGQRFGRSEERRV